MMLSLRRALLLFLVICSFPAEAQDTALIHYYRRELSKPLSDSVKIHHLCNLSWEYNKFMPDSALVFANMALEFSQEVKNPKGEAFAYHMIGIYYESQNNYPQAIDFYLRSIAISERRGDKKRLSDSYGNMGNIYMSLNKLEQARAYQMKCLLLKKEINQPEGILTGYANLGDIAMKMGKADSALYYYRLSAELSEEQNFKMGLSYNYRSIGGVYEQKGEYDKAIEYLNKALMISESSGDVLEMTAGYIMLGSVLSHQRKYDDAILYIQKGYTLCKERGFLDRLITASEGLAQAYQAKGDYQNALTSYKEFWLLKDSVFSKQNFEQIGRLQADFDHQKQEQQKEFERQAQEARQRNLRYLIIAVALLIIAFAFWRARLRKKANEKLAAAYSLVESRNKDITDSINYAKRIQDAILPSQELLLRLFPRSFVLFRPRDVVSGDFYWFSEKDGKKLVAAVDCTGHGVPGAFMSMIGNAFLDEIVNEKGITRPDLILGELRNLVIRSLKQSGIAGENKDGMDISLICFDEKMNKVQFAGANNPLWIVRTSEQQAPGPELTEITPDKRHIGYFRGQGLPFTLQEIELQRGDSLYIFSDGYADQFGGPKGKKFKYKQMKETLLSLNGKPMLQQQRALAEIFDSWKGPLEQVDDVLVIGINV